MSGLSAWFLSLGGWVMPVMFCGILLYSGAKKVDVMAAFLEGAGEGLRTALELIPALAALLCAVGPGAAGKGAGAWGADAGDTGGGIASCVDAPRLRQRVSGDASGGSGEIWSGQPGRENRVGDVLLWGYCVLCDTGLLRGGKDQRFQIRAARGADWMSGGDGMQRVDCQGVFLMRPGSVLKQFLFPLGSPLL